MSASAVRHALQVCILTASAASCASNGDPNTPEASATTAATSSATASEEPGASAMSHDVCLEHARRGTLADTLPPKVQGFEVRSKDPKKLTLVRPGRRLQVDEGEVLWKAFVATHIQVAEQISSGSHGMGPAPACADVANPSCFYLSAWWCKTSPERIVTWMSELASSQGLGDAELEINLEILEPRGPRCKDGPGCAPTPHESTKNAKYDPKRERQALGDGSGSCKDDGDCEGPGNACVAWYLTGGPQRLIGVEYSTPTFCGCVRETCSWFTQP